jgi:hypothetical protein
MMATELAPFVALAFPGPLRIVGAATSSVALLTSIATSRWARLRILPALLLPLGTLLQGLVGLRAAFLGWHRRGIYWRGTFYPIAILRPGRRVKLP